MKAPWCLGLVFALSSHFVAGFVTAQQSASYSLEEHTFNAGGSPQSGAVLASASYIITLSAVGDAVAAPLLSSASYQGGAGFVPPYPPPGEALNLRFASAATLAWDAEPSTGSYNLYRGSVADLAASNYGPCHQPGLTTPTANVAENPLAGQPFFYLVTAENRLAEEGTLGANSAGTPRPNTVPCP